jgi:hypothetical protein
MRTVSIDSRQVQLLDDEVAPFGDVTLAPAGLTGVSEAQLAHAMAERLSRAPAASDAEVLRQLRQAFPQAPLSVRVAALASLLRR